MLIPILLICSLTEAQAKKKKPKKPYVDTEAAQEREFLLSLHGVNLFIDLDST